ncbi:hypothetical protein TELCIR_11872 [Teladorsagia circumcincta]|uniref:ATP-dependent DNA ligase family profile domain-containing protein n=1 Tax=Teladorsagia circumcincta TaxID=45464 RepID=A0A2G9U876_TELCI|nr:hypothetical protein TELCIR_11872 [Teladorsagia circumcincta]
MLAFPGEEVEALFSKALGAGEEGIVVKRKDVSYQPGTRMTKNGWFKLKAYLGDNEMDVAVVAIVPEKGKDGQIAYQLAEAPPELRGWAIEGKGGFIRREHWLVVEMTAAGVRDGKFIDPVMKRIRHDKDVDEVDTIETFREYEQVREQLSEDACWINR